MQLTHRFTVPAGIDDAWTVFNDLARIEPCFPGATIDQIHGADFSGSVKVKLGPIALVYEGTGSFVERNVPKHRAVLEARGRDRRGNGTATVTVAATFASAGDETAVEVVTELTITGKPAQFDQGVIQDISDKLLEQFVNCLAQKFASGDIHAVPVWVQSATPSDTSAPATGSVALDEGGERMQPRRSATDDSSDFASTSPGRTGFGHAQPQDRDAEPVNKLSMLRAAAPVLIVRYGPPALAGLTALLIGIKIIRKFKHVR